MQYNLTNAMLADVHKHCQRLNGSCCQRVMGHVPSMSVAGFFSEVAVLVSHGCTFTFQVRSLVDELLVGL